MTGFNNDFNVDRIGLGYLFRENDEVLPKCDLNEIPSNAARVMSYCKEFFCNMAGRTYYATSVVGYGSNPCSIAQFFKNYFKTWETKSFQLRIVDESSILKSLKYFCKLEGLNAESLDKKENIGARWLGASWHFLEFSYISEERGDSINIIPLYLKNLTTGEIDGNHRSFIGFNDIIDIGSSFSLDFMRHLNEKFPNREIIIHTLLSSENIISGHYCYAQINVNQNHTLLTVQVTDPVNEKISKLFADTPNDSKKMFEQIATDLKMDLDHTYMYKGNQVANFHDCARFSTIYLLNSLKGRSPSDLTPIDIYQGFKQLEEMDYEKFHQNPAIKGVEPQCKSKFAILSGLRRIPADWFLKWMGKEVKE